MLGDTSFSLGVNDKATSWILGHNWAASRAVLRGERVGNWQCCKVCWVSLQIRLVVLVWFIETKNCSDAMILPDSPPVGIVFLQVFQPKRADSISQRVTPELRNKLLSGFSARFRSVPVIKINTELWDCLQTSQNFKTYQGVELGFRP